MHIFYALAAAASCYYGPGPEQEFRLARLRIWRAMPVETRRAISAQAHRERSDT